MFTIVDCPICKTGGARKFLWMVRCPRRGCPKYDRKLDEELRDLDRARVERSRRSARKAARPPVRPPEAVHEPETDLPEPVPGFDDGFDPGMQAVHIRYINHKGESRTYSADSTSIRDRGLYISARLAPTGRRCAFRKERVQNMDEIEPSIDPVSRLSPTERQILGYHRKHGTTSSRYEEIRKKIFGSDGRL